MGEGRGARGGGGRGGRGGAGGAGRGREDATVWPGIHCPLPVGRSSGRTLKALASFSTPGTRSPWLQDLSEPFAYEGCVRGRAAPGTPKEDKDRFKPTDGADARPRSNKPPTLPCAVLGARRHPEAGTPPQGPANSSTVKAPGPCPMKSSHLPVLGLQGRPDPTVGRRGSSRPLAGSQSQRAVLNGHVEGGHPLAAGHSRRDRL